LTIFFSNELAMNNGLINIAMSILKINSKLTCGECISGGVGEARVPRILRTLGISGGDWKTA
jgi:hypothetical protein